MAVENGCNCDFLTTDGFGEFGEGDPLGFFCGEEGVADCGEAGGEGGLEGRRISMEEVDWILRGR